MRLTRMYITGFVAGLLILSIGLFFFYYQQLPEIGTFIMVLSAIVGILPFIVGIALENKREEELSEMFLEFSRSLAESVSTGTPVSKSIVNMGKKNYGSLTPYIQKLGNQISLGIPFHTALETFSLDVASPVISRAVALIGESERAGGDIDSILESVARSIAEIEKLRKERKATISSLVVQGYIIFFVFIGIMLVMEYKILPLALELGGVGGGLGNLQNPLQESIGQAQTLDKASLTNLFLYLLLAQGLFAGLMIGKLSEGSVKAGVKHSFILASTALLVSTGVRAFFSG
jgi:archaeal flagellar protein FlaJ